MLTTTLPRTLLFVSFAVVPLYLALYCVGRRAPASLTTICTAAAVGAFVTIPYAVPTECPQLDIILRLGCGTAIMKALDMYFRRHDPPILKWPASPSVYAFHLLIELRYESFNISTARARSVNDSALREYLIHLAIFLFLQLLPQVPVIKAQGVLYAIWLIWTLINQIIKYPNSSPLFGPIYRAANLSLFWTETWHNAYTSPTRTLGYRPMRKIFGPIGGVIGGFALMAIFHVWSFVPYLRPKGLFRVGLFFLANGVGSVADYWIWGNRNTTLRVIANWMFEVFWSQYTVRECDVPDGILAIDYRNICRTKI